VNIQLHVSSLLKNWSICLNLQIFSETNFVSVIPASAPDSSFPSLMALKMFLITFRLLVSEAKSVFTDYED
jgi:hypothetical protein